MEGTGLHPYHYINSEETMSTKKQGYRIHDAGCRSLSCILRRVSCIGSYRESCIMNHAGFTMVELMVTMVVFVLVIAGASGIFTSLLTQFKQQSKIAETNIEGIVGLEIMRQDIEHAGYGLPWEIPDKNNINYNEAAAGYNDSPNNPPRAILSGNGAGFNNSDELIIKAANVARNGASQEWTHLQTGNIKRDGLSGKTLDGNDLIIVLSPKRKLIANGADWDTTYNATEKFSPPDATETYLIYGIAPPTVTALRMPFNRADYYITTANVPARCAKGTGVLSKNVISHADGSRADNLPLLDCVADMQVIFRLDTDNNGEIDNATDDISNLSAQQIREQVKEVRVYILAHEGQRDVNYTYPNATVQIPAAPDPGAGLGSTFNFAARGITNWQNYRWKVYTLVVKPNNLR